MENKKKRIRFGAYTPFAQFDEEHVMRLGEAGIDYAMVNINHIPEEKRDAMFDWMEKYGIECTIRDESFMKYYKGAGLIDFDKFDQCSYKDKPSVISATYVDEPGITHFKVLGEEIKQFKEKYPDLGVNVNLLPMYANAKQLMGGAWQAPIEYYEDKEADFENYLDEYIKYVDTDFICVDIYPHRRKPDPKHPDLFPAVYKNLEYGDYIKCIEKTANACRKSERDFWVCVQTCSWHKIIREPNGTELRWQIYTMLSYGAVMFLYYVFADRKNHSGTVLNCRGETTPLFYASKEISTGLKKMEDIYLSYRNVGAFNLNNDPEKLPYLEMETPYTSFDAITDLSCDCPLLVGCFEKKEGAGHAFTLVNYQPFDEPKTATVTFKASGKITVYRDGEPEMLEPIDGTYTVGLPTGYGVFVTVE